MTSTSVSQLYTLAVDTNDLPSYATSNPIYAQPLYVAQVTNVGSPAATHNLLIGVTLNSTVFAWDAGNGVCNSSTGSPVCWSRQGTGGAAGTNALWYDDCGSSGGLVPLEGGLPFSGIVSTPVIDTNISTPAIFLTSFCLTSSFAPLWYLHELNLKTGSDVSSSPVQIQTAPGPSGSDNADNLVSGAVQFNPTDQLQRPALLEAPIPAISGVNPVIYITFGAGAGENSTSTPYHGWFFGYNTSLTQQFAFSSTSRGCGTGGGSTQCSKFGTGSGTPGCDCLLQSALGYTSGTPNWGGHGGGMWMSGRGPAANTPGTLGDGYSHVFTGVGNGGFQEFQSSGPNNYGESILDFRLSSSVTDQTPYQSFTPYSAVLAPDLGTSTACDNPTPPPSTVPCSYTFENLNQNDYDMAVSGVLLFSDLGGTPRLVTVDKSGYGYLLTQGKLCGPSVSGCSLQNGSSSVQGFAPGDAGNIFPFGAVIAPQSSTAPVTTFCTAQDPDDCYRVTSLAFYNNTLYLWPYQEKLTALQLSNNSAVSGIGTIDTPGSAPPYTTVNLTSTCTFGSASAPCFSNQVIAGDQIVVGSQTETITAVNSDAQLVVSPGFSSTVSTSTWSYAGYFIKPIQDVFPPPTGVGYAGGSLVVASDAGSDGLVWALEAAEASGGLGSGTRTGGALYAYNTTPTGPPNPITLQRLWSSAANSFCVSPFALPTVVNGRVYVPTFALPTTSGPCYVSGQTPAISPSGIPVYGL